MIEAQLILGTALAIVGALSVWGALLMIGRPLVTALKLPTDLPDQCRFEPLPPAAQSADGAGERAALWRQRATAGHAAYQVTLLAQQAAERAAIPGANADATCQNIVEQLDAMARAATAAFDRESGPSAQVATAEHLKAAQELWHQSAPQFPDHPPANNRRLVILLVLLIVMCLWLFVLMPMLTRQAGLG